MAEKNTRSTSMLAEIITSDPELEQLPLWAYENVLAPAPCADVIGTEEMAVALSVFQAGLGGCIPSTRKDSDLERGVENLMAVYGTHAQRSSILYRCLAFYLLVNDCGRYVWERWQKDNGDEKGAIILHPAVVDAVAQAPTNWKGEFDVEQFFTIVERIARENYSH